MMTDMGRLEARISASLVSRISERVPSVNSSRIKYCWWGERRERRIGEEGKEGGREGREEEEKRKGEKKGKKEEREERGSLHTGFSCVHELSEYEAKS